VLLTTLPNILILHLPNIFLMMYLINILRRIFILKRLVILSHLVMMICHHLWISILRCHHLRMRISTYIWSHYWIWVPHLLSLNLWWVQLIWIRWIITEYWAGLLRIYFLLNYKRVISYIIHCSFIISNNT
jgi:hypothetical protein